MKIYILISNIKDLTINGIVLFKVYDLSHYNHSNVSHIILLSIFFSLLAEIVFLKNNNLEDLHPYC